MARKQKKPGHVIDTFQINPGRILARKYEVIRRLGKGWEGEVFLVREKNTAIERAIKLFYPHRNPRDKVASFYARKLHKLRHCPIAIQYHTSETITYQRTPITLQVSDFVDKHQWVADVYLFPRFITRCRVYIDNLLGKA